MFAKMTSSIRMAIASVVVLGLTSTCQAHNWVAQLAAQNARTIQHNYNQAAAGINSAIHQQAYLGAAKLMQVPPQQRAQHFAMLQQQNPQFAQLVLFYYQRLLAYGR